MPRYASIAAAALAAMAIIVPAPASGSTPEAVVPPDPQLLLTGGHTAAQRTLIDLGDFNGDGVDDLAVGSPYATADGRPDAGRVAILPVTALGSRSLEGPVGETLDILGGTRFRIGRELAAAGDVNGDGLADLLVSAPRKGVAGPKTPGSAFLVLGRRSGGVVDLASPPPGYGYEVKGITADALSSPQGLAAPGDMTGDGLADFAVVGGEYVKGAFRYRKGVYLIRGARTSADVDLQRLPGERGVKLVTVPGPAYPAIAAAGSVNGDSRPDLIVSAPQVKLPGARWPANSTFVLFTPATLRTVTIPAIGNDGFRVSGLDGPGYLTAPIAGLGDVNGDGRSDIAVIADTGGGGPGDRARMAVIFGSSSNATVNAAAPGLRGFAIRTPVSTSASTRMFDSLTPAGDADGDGHADLLIHELSGPFGGGKAGSLLFVPAQSGLGSGVPGVTIDSDALVGPAWRLLAHSAQPCSGLDLGRASVVISPALGGAVSPLLATTSAGNESCAARALMFAMPGSLKP